MENLNNQQFNEGQEMVEVTCWEPIEDEVMVTTDSHEESESKVNALAIAGAVAAGAVSAFIAGKSLYARYKKKKVEKELDVHRKRIIEEFTKTGEIDDYTEEQIEEIARYNYFIAKEGLKPVCGEYHNSNTEK